MKKHFLGQQLCAWLLFLVVVPGYGQATETLFHCGIRDKAGNL